MNKFNSYSDTDTDINECKDLNKSTVYKMFVLKYLVPFHKIVDGYVAPKIFLRRKA